MKNTFVIRLRFLRRYRPQFPSRRSRPKSVLVMFDLVLEAPFTAGVAPGVGDNVAPVAGDKGTSGKLGKLSVYNILAKLLHRTNRCD